MPGGAIDFDGTNDGYLAQISSITAGGGMPQIFLHGYLNYDAQVGVKTLAYFVDGGDSSKFAALTKSGTTLSWTVQSSVGNALAYSATIAASTWFGFQCYAYPAPALTMSVRVWSTGVAGSWSTSSVTTGTPAWNTNLNNLYIGWNGTSNFFNGRLAHMYLADFDPTTDAEAIAIADMLGQNYTPDAMMPLIYGYLGTLRQYWPMQKTDLNTDVFQGATLSDSVIGSGLGSGTPTTFDSSPRIVIPGRMAA